MKKIISIAIIAAACNMANAQTLEWVKAMGAASTDRALCVKTDAAGNVYTTGVFRDTVDFDPGPGTATAIATSSGNAFILKTDAAGNFVNVITFGNSTSSHIAAACNLAFDAGGNMYVGGYFDGSNVDFDPDTSSHKVTAAGSGNNAFILKLDANGQFMWVKNWSYNRDGGTGEEGPAFTLDASGNILTAGRFVGDIDFDPGPGVYKLITTPENGYVSKLDPDGNFLWAKHLIVDTPVSKFLFAKSISSDAAGNIYVAGNFAGKADFDPDSTGVFNEVTQAQHGFVVKLDAGGNFLWAKKIGNDNNPLIDYHTANAVAATTNGDVYVTGSFMNTVDLGGIQLMSEGISDIYIAKLDASGNWKWANSYGSLYDGEEGIRLALDDQGGVYATGSYRGTIDFRKGPGIANLTTNGAKDVFVLKLDADGNFVWVRGYGGAEQHERIQSIAVDGNGVYTVGRFVSTVNFDPNGNLEITANSTNSNYPDFFIHKMFQFKTGIHDQGNKGNVLLYPNPAIDRFTIDISNTPELSGRATITDMRGRDILSVDIKNGSTEVNTGNMAKGIYLVKLQYADHYEVMKLLLQ